MKQTKFPVFVRFIQIVNRQTYNMLGGGKCHGIKKKQGKGIGNDDERWRYSGRHCLSLVSRKDK